MQLFPQSSNSAKMFDSNNAYQNNQAESAKGFQQIQEVGQQIAQIITAIMA